MTKLTKDEKMNTVLLHFISYPNLSYKNNLPSHIPYPKESVPVKISCGIIPIFHQFNHHYIPSYFRFLFTTGVPCLVVMDLDTQLESLRLTEGKVDK